ncbi:magnesium transporter CorA family protein [archaeon]|nr:magnesium transporter CorA family protein [archaeon]
MLKTEVFHKNSLKFQSLERTDLKKEITWINCFNPKQDELKLINKKTDISILSLKNCLDQYEIPRLEKTKDYNLIILKVLHDKKPKTFGVFYSKKFIVTISSDNFVLQLSEEEFKQGLEYCVYFLISHLMKEVSHNLEEIEDELDDLEIVVFKNHSEHIVGKLFSLKKELYSLRKVLHSYREVVPKMSTSKYFTNLLLEVNQLLERDSSNENKLTSILDMHMSSVSNTLNKTMKSFTVMASLVLIPMLISGIYGMNVLLPFAENPYAFFMVILIMVISMALMIIYFKSKKWL